MSAPFCGSLAAMTTTWAAALLVVCGLALAGCGSDDEDGPSCAMRTVGLAGEAPACSNYLECGDDEWELACDGTTGECLCLNNGALEKTIPYHDSYCPADFSTADFDAHEAAAREACGWP